MTLGDSSSNRGLARFAWLTALGFVAVGFTAGFAPADAFPTHAHARMDQYLRDAGLTWADLPDVVDVTTTDLVTGHVAVAALPLDEALASFDAPSLLEPSPQAVNGAANVVGYVRHNCNDGLRLCYATHTEDTNGDGYRDGPALVDGSAAYDPAAAAYDDATGDDVLVPGGQVHYIDGKYRTGSHRSGGSGLGEVALEDGAPATGSSKADRSMRGAGVGTVRMFAFSWGVDLYISFGQLEAIGVFSFCNAEEHPDCEPVRAPSA